MNSFVLFFSGFGYTYTRRSWGESFYKIYPPTNYGAAKDQCESDGTYLAIPRSEAENDFIASLLPNKNIWIGINDLAKEGSFVRVDGRPISWTKWDSGEPNDNQGEDAVELRQEYGQTTRKAWNDQRDKVKNWFVCLLHI